MHNDCSEMMKININSPKASRLIFFHTRLLLIMQNHLQHFMFKHTLHPTQGSIRIAVNDYIEDDDDDWEEQCEERCNLGEGVGFPHMGWVVCWRNIRHSNLGWDVWKLKKVVLANIMCLHLTLNVPCVCNSLCGILIVYRVTYQVGHQVGNYTPKKKKRKNKTRKTKKTKTNPFSFFLMQHPTIFNLIS